MTHCAPIIAGKGAYAQATSEAGRGVCQHVERLEEALNDSTIRPEATDALRILIDRIVLYPARGVERSGQSFMASWARSSP